jgi:hypothetical protein
MHSFSVQMSNTTSISGLVVDRRKDGVFLEGELGSIEEIELIENRVLTIKGTNGTIRIDLTRDELQNALNPPEKKET